MSTQTFNKSFMADILRRRATARNSDNPKDRQYFSFSRSPNHDAECLLLHICPNCGGEVVSDTKLGRAGDDYEERDVCTSCGRNY